MDESTPPDLVSAQRITENHSTLHDVLTLMRTLRPSSGFRPVRKTDWHRFLDHLAWLCDFKRGGETVISIAAEKTGRGAKFWIASNNKGTDAERSAVHLRLVLTRLSSLQEHPTTDPNEIAQEIHTESIALSRLRVHDYCKKLRRHVANAETDTCEVDESGRALLRDIRDLLASKHNQKRCNMAYNFQREEAFKQLSMRAEDDISHNTWYFIHHYIGRLGSWSKASRIVVIMALQLTHVFKHFQLDKVDKVTEIIRPLLHGDTTLTHALTRTLPKYDSQLLEGMIRKTQSASDVDICTTFSEKYRDPKFVPMVHAEILMMEHFYSNHLDFFDGDRYIGCSKPSCYCCDVYLKLHPGRFEIRPSHGNVWMKWCLPLEINEVEEGKRKHAAKMLKRVVNHIIHDLEIHLLSEIRNPMRMLDSTTATSVLSLLAHRFDLFL